MTLNSIPKKEELSPWFCVAPWTHTFISPQSERRLCCASQEQATWQRQAIDSKVIPIKAEYEPQTLEQHWNSEKMKDIRKRILAGEKIPECTVCHDSVLNIHTYKQYFTETLFPHKINYILKNTELDGSYEDLPISYDYRISNLCSFKCRMCGEQLSSAWEVEKRQNGFDLSGQLWLAQENRDKIHQFQNNVVSSELQLAALEGRLEEIYWVGGEPLMYELHWDLMKYLVLTEQAKNITVRYNTNLNKISHKSDFLYYLLPWFKKVNICASMDGVGEIAEYIRTGLKWEDWLSNFKAGIFLNDQFGMDAMVIDVTITLPGLFSMKELMELAVELGVKSYVKICFDFSSNTFMSPLSLPHEILDPILDDLIEKGKSLGPLVDVYVKTFESMKTRQTFDEKYSNYQQGLKKGKAFAEKLESIRKSSTSMEKILSCNDAALTWWKNI